MTVFEKLSNRINNMRFDLEFLRRKDVSLRFKILNILSGDRLRPAVAFVAARISDVIRNYNYIAEYKALNDGVLDEAGAEYIIDMMHFYAEHAAKDVSDIWDL